jgi:hypothetical protein
MIKKVLSISRKKVHCHELMYAKYDADTQTRPRIEFKDFTLDATEIDEAIQTAKDVGENNSEVIPDLATTIPKHVQSVKAMSDAKRNQNFLTPELGSVPNNMINAYHEATGSGESLEFNDKVLETMKFHGDLLLDDVRKMKERLGKDTLSESILKSLKKVEVKLDRASTQGELKRGKKSNATKIDPGNILRTKRERKTVIRKNSKNSSKPNPKAKSRNKENDKRRVVIKARLTLPALKPDDRVKILTKCFGHEYAIGQPKYSYGKLIRVNKGKIVDVLWDNTDGSTGERMDARLSQLRRVNPIMVALKRLSENMKVNGWPMKTT